MGEMNGTILCSTRTFPPELHFLERRGVIYRTGHCVELICSRVIFTNACEAELGFVCHVYVELGRSTEHNPVRFQGLIVSPEVDCCQLSHLQSK